MLVGLSRLCTRCLPCRKAKPARMGGSISLTSSGVRARWGSICERVCSAYSITTKRNCRPPRWQRPASRSRSRWGWERAAAAVQCESWASAKGGLAGISLSAALGRFRALDSVRNTPLWPEPPKKRRSGKTPLIIWPSHFVQISLMVGPPRTKDDILPGCPSEDINSRGQASEFQAASRLNPHRVKLPERAVARRPPGERYADGKPNSVGANVGSWVLRRQHRIAGLLA